MFTQNNNTLHLLMNEFANVNKFHVIFSKVKNEQTVKLKSKHSHVTTVSSPITRAAAGTRVPVGYPGTRRVPG